MRSDGEDPVLNEQWRSKDDTPDKRLGGVSGLELSNTGIDEPALVGLDEELFDIMGRGIGGRGCRLDRDGVEIRKEALDGGLSGIGPSWLA